MVGMHVAPTHVYSYSACILCCAIIASQPCSPIFIHSSTPRMIAIIALLDLSFVAADDFI